jgi:hypothetical protein
VSFALRLSEDRLGAHARLTLPPTPRVVYGQHRAWDASGAAALAAAEVPARFLRFELLRGGEVLPAAAGKVESRCLLEHAIDLDPARAWLMRCDRVDFAPGGVALPHGHQGGGIRCLLEGALEVTVGDRAPRLMRPGDAWFESGREPVLAKGVTGDADGVRAGVDPAAGDPGPILDRLRGSRRRRARPPAAVHGLCRRAACPSVARIASAEVRAARRAQGRLPYPILGIDDFAEAAREASAKARGMALTGMPVPR